MAGDITTIQQQIALPVGGRVPVRFDESVPYPALATLPDGRQILFAPAGIPAEDLEAFALAALDFVSARPHRTLQQAAE